jgi:DNA-binding transcriptional MerR regulator
VNVPGRKPKTQRRRKDGFLTTGEMARLSKSTLRTVRFYEEQGLLEPISRTVGGHRLFREAELAKLRLMSDLRAAGFGLEEVREIVDLKRGHSTGADAARRAITELGKKIAQMHERARLLSRLAADLEASRRQLDACTRCEDPRFPVNCGQCHVMTSAPLAKALRVLWNTES